MPNALIIDTSTDVVSVAFGSSDGRLVHRSMQQHAQQSENIFTAIDVVLKEADANVKQIDVIGVGVGPGMFTGVRVGVTSAHSLAHALSAKLVYLSSLEIAALSTGYAPLVIAKDARRHELYAAHYESNLQEPPLQIEVDGITFVSCMKRLEEERLISPQSFVDSINPDDVVAIDSTETYEELSRLSENKVLPLPIDTSKSVPLVLQAYKNQMFTDVFDPKILYLRKSDAELSWGKA